MNELKCNFNQNMKVELLEIHFKMPSATWGPFNLDFSVQYVPFQMDFYKNKTIANIFPKVRMWALGGGGGGGGVSKTHMSS